ncbi:DUF6868 family protein [Paludisphaera rhizosphaerae]|uniref:DUF6868 family protein n=1 Tax=Paludisphaera rhizosphaerae TaxID=2711216 RepID=UPI0013EA3D6C|nr:hypothetical protein [Paludisphaera rhizosphaerae]
MDTEFLCRFLLWSLAVNYTLLLAWFFAFAFARDVIHRLHGLWFRFSDETFDLIHYVGMLAYKIGILLFNLAPLIALWLMRKGG